MKKACKTLLCGLAASLVWCAGACAAGPQAAAADPAAKTLPQPADDLSKYLADISGGTVSAGTMVGLEGSAITEVQSSQDLIVAFKPFSSARSSRNGFGFAISPFRTTLLPMRSADYRDNNAYRFLGATTLSYAENPASIDSIGYRKSVFSIDSSFYWDKNQDPVLLAQDAFNGCDVSAPMKKYIYAKDAADAKAVSDEVDARLIKCIDSAIETKGLWNATRFSLSLGTGWIRSDAENGAREQLGKFVTLNGIFKAGPNAALYLAARRSKDELNQKSLKAGPVTTSNSSLLAARLTYGSHDDQGKWKLLIEVSNANSETVTESNNVYKQAVGIDTRITKGVWVEFRVGKSRTFDGKTTETSSLLNLKISPTQVSKLFGKTT
jgi:hypothetical protein